MTTPRSPELLAAGRAPVYVATWLYDPSGRHLGAIWSTAASPACARR